MVYLGDLFNRLSPGFGLFRGGVHRHRRGRNLSRVFFLLQVARIFGWCL